MGYNKRFVENEKFNILDIAYDLFNILITGYEPYKDYFNGRHYRYECEEDDEESIEEIEEEVDWFDSEYDALWNTDVISVKQKDEFDVIQIG